MEMTQWIIQIAVFLGVASTTCLLVRKVMAGGRLSAERYDQLRSRDAASDSQGSHGLRRILSRGGIVSSVGREASNHLLPSSEAYRERIRLRLAHAGVYAPSAVSALMAVRLLWMVLAPTSALAAAWLLYFDWARALLFGALVGLGGLVAPSFWLDQRKAKRHLILSRSVPDFLDLMVACVEGGLSLEASLQRVTHEIAIAHPLLASELRTVERQIELGASPESALGNLAERTGYDPLRSLGVAVAQARRFGTGIGRSLRIHADTLRTQREQRAEELAHKAAVKILFPTLLFIFPAVFVVLAGPAVIQLREHFAAPETDDSPPVVGRRSPASPKIVSQPASLEPQA